MPDRSSVQVRDLDSRNGTFVRGARVSQAIVGLDELIQIGGLPVTGRQLVPFRASSPSQAGNGPVAAVGREGQGPFFVDLPAISGRHAEVRLGASGLEIRDLGSTNGTFVSGRRAVDWTPVSAGDAVVLASFRVPPQMLLRWGQALMGGAASAPVQAQSVPIGRPMTVGRAPDCDIILDHPSVSWHHARIEPQAGGYLIIDLGSTNGIFLDETRVKRAFAPAGSVIRVGAVPMELRAEAVSARRDYRGEVRLDVLGVTRQLGPEAGGRIILDDVSLTIFPGEMVALMGPSGAGKTTLLEVLTGQRLPSAGHVLLNGADLHAGVPERIGYVPQEDVMHRDLTVFEVLYHAAKLRLPSDLPDLQVQDHVERLIIRMGLAGVRDSLIGGEQVRGVSGGQRKRVNIAIELLTEPPLLFLDEPTSGLDATSTLEVLTVLRQLSDEGKTVVMTIHQPRVEAFKLMDMVILLAKGGKLAYFGPSVPGVVEYFKPKSRVPFSAHSNPADYALDVLDPPDGTQVRPPDQWKADYRSSEQHRSYVLGRREDRQSVGAVAAGSGFAVPSGFHQLGTLIGRLLLRKGRDRSASMLQFIQPLVVGGLLYWTFRDVDWPTTITALPGMKADCTDETYASPQLLNKAHAVMFLVATTAFWLGCSNVARELVAERAVFRRERMAGLSTVAYLFANFAVQIGIGFVQMLILIGLAWMPILEADPVTALALTMLPMATGIAVGMLISAVNRTEVAAISWLPILLVPQLLLSGYFIRFGEMESDLQTLAGVMPIRWGFQAMVELEYDEVAASLSCSRVEDVFGFPVYALEDLGMILVGFIAMALMATWAKLTQTTGAAS